MARQLWIADACRAAGLRVVEVAGWRDRGSANFSPRGLVLHHTAGGANGDMPSLSVIVGGRADLPGPLAQFGLGRSGTVYVVAAGRANHAGSGGWRGLSGNTAVWGIEAENTGRGESWPAVQLNAYHRLAGVLAARSGFGADMVCAHREWTPRKIDPAGIDMAAFRARVSQLLRPPAHVPTVPARSPEEDDMYIVWRMEPGKDSVPGFLLLGSGKVPIPPGTDVDELRREGMRELHLSAALVDAIPVAG